MMMLIEIIDSLFSILEKVNCLSVLTEEDEKLFQTLKFNYNTYYRKDLESEKD